MQESPGISVVIPLYNEEESVDELYTEIADVLNKMQEPYEIILVDDGSKDSTVVKVLALARKDSNIKLIEFRRNFGQTAAMAAGFAETKYPVVVSLDGDLQNDPRAIPDMVKELRNGYDLVAGWRKSRKDKFLSRRLPSILANKIISLCTRVQLHDYGCTLKAMTGEVARGIRLYGEMHRFIPALADEMGAKIKEIPVGHRERKYGSSKYGISRTVRVILDLITVKFLLGYSKRPIHFFGTIGFLSSGIGTLMLAVITFQRYFMSVPMGNRPVLSLGVMMVMIGLQFIVFGLLAEVLARTYYESQRKNIYSIRKIYSSENTKSRDSIDLIDDKTDIDNRIKRVAVN